MADQNRDLEHKKALFELLDALEQPDEYVDVGFSDSIAAMNQAATPQAAPAAACAPPPRSQTRFDLYDMREVAAPPLAAPRERSSLQVPTPATLKRSHTLPNRVEHRALEIVSSHAVPSTQPPVQPLLKHSASLPPNEIKTSGTKTSMVQGAGKRKRSGEVQLMPEAQRTFSGLQLYFVPNNDIARARRLRIEKSIQYGATWAKTWNNEVTHIVVDIDLEFGDVLKATGISEVPASVVVVNERYLSDCISWKHLVDANSPIYHVKGYALREVQSPPQSSVPSEKSLQIKSARPRDGLVIYDTSTTSRTSEAGSIVAGGETDEHEGVPSADLSYSLPPILYQREERKESAVHTEAQQTRTNDPTKSRDLNEDLKEEKFKDPLRALIIRAKAAEHLPIDSDEDRETSPPSSAVSLSDHYSSDEEASSKAKPKKKGKSDGLQNFTCMQDHDTQLSECSNGRTIEVLQEMANYYDSIHDQWRTVAYRKAISILRKQDKAITSKEDAERLPFIGSRLAAKVEEIYWTNRLRRLESTRSDSTDQVLAHFAKIYGVGYILASKWVRQGYRTFEDLLANVSLTENQRIGIEHFDDFQARIPRAEVALHGEIVRDTLKTIDPAFQVTVGGSYRRGSKDSGDIDLIITKPGVNSAYLRKIILDTLVPDLFKKRFLTASLAVTSKDTGSKWHGACQLPPAGSNSDIEYLPENRYPWRRIDLLLVPSDEIGAAMIYFTGNDIFNRSMRLLARTKGMRLNQRGLYKDVSRGPGQVRYTDGQKIAGEDELEIFRILGVPWREAEMRNC